MVQKIGDANDRGADTRRMERTARGMLERARRLHRRKVLHLVGPAVAEKERSLQREVYGSLELTLMLMAEDIGWFVGDDEPRKVRWLFVLLVSGHPGPFARRREMLFAPKRWHPEQFTYRAIRD